MKPEVKWLTLDCATGERTLKQHAIQPREIFKPYTREKYVGNMSLCKRVFAGNENEEVELWDNLESEPMIENRCKICTRKFQVIQNINSEI